MPEPVHIHVSEPLLQPPPKNQERHRGRDFSLPRISCAQVRRLFLKILYKLPDAWTKPMTKEALENIMLLSDVDPKSKKKLKGYLNRIERMDPDQAKIHRDVFCDAFNTTKRTIELYEDLKLGTRGFTTEPPPMET